VLKRLKVRGFKSLGSASVEFARVTVLFGPNAAGKSNLLDALQALSRIGTCRTLSDALSEPIRGYPIEAFSFPSGGLAELLSRKTAGFTLESDLEIRPDSSFRYRVSAEIQPDSGGLSVRDENLTALNKAGDPKGSPRIEVVGDQLLYRQKGKAGAPRQETAGKNYALLSDPRLGGPQYREVEECRKELMGWRVYYLDPRVAMRSAKPPADVQDIGVLGEDIAPFLYRLQAEKPKCFAAVKRTLRSLVPSVEDLSVDLDKRRGSLDIQIKQGGTDFSSRIVSEGTLRVLALCSLVVNPWGGSLLAFEEPENGVHPRRLELIAKLLMSFAESKGKQLIVTTHSPLFCDCVLRQAHPQGDDVALFNVRHPSEGTLISRVSVRPSLFKSQEISEGLLARDEDGALEPLILRGLLDE
jgi:predicted ATPase